MGAERYWDLRREESLSERKVGGVDGGGISDAITLRIVCALDEAQRHARSNEAIKVAPRAAHVRLQHGAHRKSGATRRSHDLVQRIKALWVLGVGTHEPAHLARSSQDLVESHGCAPFGEAERGELHADVRLEPRRRLCAQKGYRVGGIFVGTRPNRRLTEAIERGEEAECAHPFGGGDCSSNGVAGNEAPDGAPPPGGPLHKVAKRSRAAHPQQYCATEGEERVHAAESTAGLRSAPPRASACVAQAAERGDRLVDRPGDLANRFDGAGNEEVDPIARSHAATTHHAQVGAEGDDPAMFGWILGAELREDADLNRGAVVNLRSVNPAEHQVRRSHPLEIGAIDLRLVEPLHLNELLVWHEDLVAVGAQSRGDRREG